MASCQASREFSSTYLLRRLAQSLETHKEESMAIKLQGDRKGQVLARDPVPAVVEKLSPTVRENLFLPFVVKKSSAPHIFINI